MQLTVCGNLAICMMVVVRSVITLPTRLVLLTWPGIMLSNCVVATPVIMLFGISCNLVIQWFSNPIISILSSNVDPLCSLFSNLLIRSNSRSYSTKLEDENGLVIHIINFVILNNPCNLSMYFIIGFSNTEFVIYFLLPKSYSNGRRFCWFLFFSISCEHFVCFSNWLVGYDH
jgi:hypothetical protein